MQGVACRLLLDGSVWCCLEWRVRFRCIAGCCFKVLLAGLLVPVQRPAAGCRCSGAVRVGCALWSWHVGAAAGRFLPWRVPLQRAVCFLGTSVLLQGPAVRVRCAHEAWVLVSLQGVAARCLWQSGRWALMEITFMPRQERRALACQQNISLCYLGTIY